MAIADMVLAFPMAVSDLAIAGISAGAALLGGVLGALAGGLITYLVAQSRHQHERELEQERWEHERELEQRRSDHERETRERQELDVARGLARVMASDFAEAEARVETERDIGDWSESATWNASLGPDDRKDLFRHLRASEFTAVVQGESGLRCLDLMRESVLGDDSEARRKKPADLTDIFDTTLWEIRSALAALRRLGTSGDEEPEPEAGLDPEYPPRSDGPVPVVPQNGSHGADHLASKEEKLHLLSEVT
jgi:hypothetical protein